MSTVICWFRRDLRLHDNRALQAALASGALVIPLFIVDPALMRGERFGLPRLKFMLSGLAALDHDLGQFRRRLLVRYGSPSTVLPQLIAASDAQALYFNADYSPYAQRRDTALVQRLSIPVHAFDDAMLHPPYQVLKPDGSPYVIFTPYKRIWLAAPKPTPEAYLLKADHFHTLHNLENEALPTLESLGFGTTINVPPAGESIALRRLQTFVEHRIDTYGSGRDLLGVNPFTEENAGTSGLSPYFRFGMVSARRAHAAAVEARNQANSAAARHSMDVWVSELAWRDFYMQTLYHFPHIDNTSFRPEFERLKWNTSQDDLLAWKEARTGYPVIDAAMRQLNALGWMHNRARMIVASFLTKDLLIHWREGDLHFMRQLIDGDPAANNGGWQWSAGTGKDAQPFFRIFHPVTQSIKFDPRGAYIRHWLPELRDVPDKFIHTPWKMDSSPASYPPPMVDHDFARLRALDAYHALRRGKIPGK